MAGIKSVHYQFKPDEPMKIKILSLLLSFFLTTTLFSQDWETAREPAVIASVNDAAQMAEEIVKAAGLKSNFRIAEAQVPNAMAVVYQGKRYILYNPHFIKILTRATGTKWAAVSVLAHEIGHHLYRNSVNKGKTPLATELEADEFSGYVLQKMGASLEEAQAAMKILGTSYATRTHPARNDRIGSIALGWENAGGVIEETAENTVSAAEPEIVQPLRQPSVLSPKNIAATIYFNASPGTDYYLTTRMNVVKVEDNQLELIGRMTKTNDRDYPFIIYDDSGYRVYVDAYGKIVSGRGIVLGKLSVRES